MNKYSTKRQTIRETGSLFSATGIPSLFLIFAVLMLVILSLLGYGTSRQDLSASTLSLEQTTSYYQSCNSATDFYTDAVSSLKEIWQQAPDTEEYFQLAGAYFEKIPEATWDAASHQVQYVQEFSKTQSLLVKLLVSDPSTNADSFLSILTWNTIVTSDWTPDTSQSVYKGE